MAKRYIVLEAASGLGTLRGGGRVLSADPEALRDVQVTPRVATLSAREVNEARRVPEVLGTAPIMPVTLVRPKALKAGEEADAPDVVSAAWGVDTVGATRSNFTGAGVTVAVLDSGIDAAHEAFRGKPIVQKDFTGEGDGDANGHGTHCAGTVFGGEVKGLRIGVAPGVSKALIGKVLDHEGSGSTEQIIDGLMWALREGANVVSMSIGFDFPGMVRELMEKDGLEVEPATSQGLAAYRDNVRLFDALAALVRAHSSMFANAVVIAAAGNESDRPRYEIATAPPANADGFISVGALQK